MGIGHESVKLGPRVLGARDPHVNIAACDFPAPPLAVLLQLAAYLKGKAPRALTPSTRALVLSRGWPELSRAAQTLAVTLIEKMLPDGQMLSVTHAQLGRWTGIRSRETLRKALTELCAIGLVVTARTATRRENDLGWAFCQTTIRLNWPGATFQQFLRYGFTPQGKVARRARQVQPV